MPAFAYSDFRRYLVGSFLATLAAQMQIVAIGWQVYSITRQPLDLGLIGLSQFLPFALLVLPAGHVADRGDRRLIVGLCYALQTVAALLLLSVTLLGVSSVLPIFAILALAGVSGAFSMPTGQALLPNLVPSQAFSNAVAVNSSAWQLATIAGPALGGLLFLLGPGVTYAVVAGCLAVAALLVVSLRVRRGGRSAEPATVAALFSGVRFVRSRPIVLGSISLDLFAVLFGGATALLPAYASDILHVGPAGLGVLRAAPAIGAVATGALVAARPIRHAVGRWMFGGVAAFGIATLVFAVSRNVIISVAALVALGAADMVSVYIRHLLVQLATPDAIRGRVSAVNAVFIGASNELGEFESGLTAAFLGVVPAVLVGGITTVLVAIVWARLFPALWSLRRFPEAATTRDGTPDAAAAVAEWPSPER